MPFHTHGAGYSETIVGRKRWYGAATWRNTAAEQLTRNRDRLLYAPGKKPPFDPDESTLAWLRRWQSGAPEFALHGAPLDCTLSPGEAIYFPTGARALPPLQVRICADAFGAGWWHATLNVDEAVFVSTFVNYAPAPRLGGALLPRRAGGAPPPRREAADEPERELR